MSNSPTDSDSMADIPVHRRAWRRRALVVFATVLVVVFGPYLYSRMVASHGVVRVRTIDDVAPGIASQDSSENELRLVTWNIAHGRGTADGNWVEGGKAKTARINEIAELLRKLDADIVVLNEVDFSATWSGGMNQADAIARGAGYPFLVEQSNLDFRVLWYRWNFGNAILSRFPIENAVVVELPPKASWESWTAGHKRGIHCDVSVPGIGNVSVVAVHLESRGEPARINSIPILRSLVQDCDKPLILAGDLNTTPAGFPKASTGSDGRSAFDQLVVEGALLWQPQNLPDTSQLTFSTMKPENVIDWILVSNKHWEFIDYGVVTSELSDHFPVQTVIKLRR